jgi:uncharacterized membrane protein YdjX (TVP38/TMEM64 family)
LQFPTDLASFLDLIHQHGDAAYSLMFAYAASHSLLLALFAGYAAHSGALDFATLIMVCWFGSFAGDVIRFWIGRRFGTRWLGSFPKLERAVQTAGRLADRHYVWMILFHRYPHAFAASPALPTGYRSCPGRRSWRSISPRRACGPARSSRLAMPLARSRRRL